MPAPESNFLSWVAKADSDLLNIENNLAADEVPWDTVCFHAQQAAEKMLKAILVFHGILPPRTHDLVALLAHCIRFHPSLAALEDSCRRLTYYAVAARYPDDLYQLSEEDARPLVATAHQVRAEILRHLPAAAGGHDMPAG
jgi:HEPN domain-containing protein